MLLAAMAPDDLDRLLEGLPLPAYTAKTITSARALRRELAAVRRQGIAYDDCELDDDVRCIALPVRDFAGRCVGAIGISGPVRSEEHTSELQSLMRIPYAVFCLKKKRDRQKLYERTLQPQH